MTEIITPQGLANQKIDEYIQLVGKWLEHEAITLAKNTKCKRCGRSDRLKVVPLHEYPHPLPSKIVLYCDACKFNEVVLSSEKNKKFKHYLNEIQTMITDSLPLDTKEKAIKDKKVVNELINPVHPKKRKK